MTDCKSLLIIHSKIFLEARRMNEDDAFIEEN